MSYNAKTLAWVREQIVIQCDKVLAGGDGWDSMVLDRHVEWHDNIPGVEPIGRLAEPKAVWARSRSRSASR